jgi:hypothetical protein
MKKLVTALKYFINLFWGIIFLLFASVQFNDPDPVIWIFAYSLTAVLCFTYLKSTWAIKLKWLYLLVGLAMLVGSVIQFPPQWEGFGTEMKTANNELARESIGLLLCGLVLLVQFFCIKPKATAER